MITYIIKAILFSGLLLAIYHLFLEREKMHRFNRFYLLLSIILPFAVPLVPIKTGSPLLSSFESIIPAANKLQVTDLKSSFLPAAQTDESSTGNNNSSINIRSTGNNSISGHDNNTKSRPSIAGTNTENDAITGNSHGITGSDNYNKTLSHNKGITLHGNLNDESNNNSGVAGDGFRNMNQRLLSNLLLFVYLAITTGLFLKFSANFHAFRMKIKLNRVAPYHEAKLVLTKEGINPYSFLNYIFVNEQEFKNNTIELAVLEHELTHIRQKHTMDILFFELVRIFGWINPFLPFYRNALRLNHEFQADECAVKKFRDPATYQMLLLEKIRQENNLILSSPFDFIMIKKRMIMMSKKASPKSAVSKQLALIPVTGLAAMLFMNITVATDIEASAEPQSANFDIISSEANIEKDLGNKSVIDPEDRKQIQAPPPPFSDDFSPVPPTRADIKSVQPSLFLVYIDGWIVDNSILEYYEEIDFAHHHVSDISERSVYHGKFDSTAVFYTHAYFNKHRGLKFEQSIQPGNGVPQELLVEYEKIINKYTPASMSGGEQTRNINENISTDDRLRLEEIYFQMTIEQRKDQRVVFWSYPPVSRNIPTSNQFESFKDPKLYGVWIDGNRVDNRVLEDYSNTDFARMGISRLMKNAKNYGKHEYQLNLMTNGYFEEFREKMSGRKGNMLMYRILINQDETSELQPPGEVQSGTISWEVSKRTDASGNEFNEITGVFEGTMWSKDVDEVPLKVKIFVTNRKGGEMFTEFYEAGSESPAKLYPESPNYTKIIVYSRLPSGEIIEMEQTSGGSHMWDFYIRDVTTASGSQDSRYGEPREGDFLNFILEQDEKLNLRVQLHPAEHKIYRFNLDPTGLKELFAKL